MPRRPLVMATTALFALVVSAGWSPASARGLDAIISVYTARSLTSDGTADLTGDGRGDIVQKIVDGTTTTFGVRSGIDGRLVWAHNTQRSLAAIRAMRIGTPARSGLVVETRFSKYVPGGNTTYYESVELVAFDGATGQRLWRWEAHGYHDTPYAEPDRWDHVPRVVGVLRGPAGAASDVLVSIRTDDIQQPTIVAGKNGSVRTVGNAPVGTDLEEFTPVGDVDADGHDDVAVVLDRSSLQIRSSATDALAWSRLSVIDSIYGAMRIPAIGRRDAVMVGFFNDDTYTGHQEVLAGSDGHRISSVPCCPNELVGDIDGDGLSDVISHGVGSRSYTIYDKFTATSTGTGRQLWTKEVSHTPTYPAHDRFFDRVVGDRNADGVNDYSLDVYHYHDYASPPYAANHYLVNGKTGGLTDGKAIGTPLNVSVDGHGDDFALVTANKTLTATVYDGATRNVVWTYQRSASSPISLEHYGAADMTADGRADLYLVMDIGSQIVLSLVDGSTHLTRWTVTL